MRVCGNSKEVIRRRKNFFPNIVMLVKHLLLRPVSSAECERTFSCLRRLKTWLRSTMTQERLHGVVIGHVHQITLFRKTIQALRQLGSLENKFHL